MISLNLRRFPRGQVFRLKVTRWLIRAGEDNLSHMFTAVLIPIYKCGALGSAGEGKTRLEKSAVGRNAVIIYSAPAFNTAHARRVKTLSLLQYN